MSEFDHRNPPPDSDLWHDPDGGSEGVWPRPLSSREASAYRRPSDRDRRRPPGPRETYDRDRGWDNDRRRRSGPPREAWVMGLAALAVCLGLGLFYLVGRRSDANLATTGDLSTLPAMGTVSSVTSSESPQTTGGSPASSAATSPNNTLSGRVTGSQILVTGEVPSTQAAAALKLLLEQVMGVGNVDTDEVTVNAAAPSPDRIDMIVDSEVVFPVGGAEIQDEFLPTLDRMATLMKTNTGVTTVVEGHADAQGDKAINLSLSQRRADAVVAYLESKGIDSTRLTPVGKGSTEPIADNDTAEGRRQNRRIEFSVHGFRLEL